MKASEFRKLALELPEVLENEHHGHPDFRIGKKIFATIGPEGDWGMVKLHPVDQDEFVKLEPEAYEPVPGAWGRQGCTRVTLSAAKKTSVRRALELAWRKIAPAKLRKELDGS
jgi:hypothetical protein